MQTQTGWTLVDRRHNVHALITNCWHEGYMLNLVVKEPVGCALTHFNSIIEAKSVAKAFCDVTVDPMRIWLVIDWICDTVTFVLDAIVDQARRAAGLPNKHSQAT
jgi:hypothetical protein